MRAPREIIRQVITLKAAALIISSPHILTDEPPFCVSLYCFTKLAEPSFFCVCVCLGGGQLTQLATRGTTKDKDKPVSVMFTSVQDSAHLINPPHHSGSSLMSLHCGTSNKPFSEDFPDTFAKQQ